MSYIFIKFDKNMEVHFHHPLYHFFTDQYRYETVCNLLQNLHMDTNLHNFLYKIEELRPVQNDDDEDTSETLLNVDILYQYNYLETIYQSNNGDKEILNYKLEFITLLLNIFYMEMILGYKIKQFKEYLQVYITKIIGIDLRGQQL